MTRAMQKLGRIGCRLGFTGAPILGPGWVMRKSTRGRGDAEEVVYNGLYYVWDLDLKHSLLCQPSPTGRFSFVLLFIASRKSGVKDIKFRFGLDEAPA